MNKTLYIGPDGTIKTFDEVEFLPELGNAEQQRASHVLPVHRGKRLAFLLIRRVLGETGRIASWTRSWRGPWQVSWASTPNNVEFVHPSRRVCINWEREALDKRLSGGES